MKRAPLSLDEIETLGELLASIPDPFIPMEPDMLDGFLTAIALMRKPPATEAWFRYILDIEGRDVRLEKVHRGSLLRELIFRRGAELENAILTRKPIDPILFEDEENADFLAPLRAFSNGVLLACCQWPELTENSNDSVKAALVGLLRYTDLAKDDEATPALVDSMDEGIVFANLDEALADIEACVGEVAEVTRLSGK